MPSANSVPSTAACLRPVSARSALLGLLLGAEVPALTARELVAGGQIVGFTEPTVRVALSRMTSAGDLERTDEGGYRLSERLLHRQRRQAAAIHVIPKPWNGDWDMFVVTASGRSAADRATLRAALIDLRLAELREGVWLRPANLYLDWPTDIDTLGERLTTKTVRDPAGLAARLWDLSAWANRARALLAAIDTSDPVMRFTACATSVRHLLDDPLLPYELLPSDWPGSELRQSHLEYNDWLIETRRSITRA
ncbi:PaaX family transcriptional regulator C-terminal domain-containing protein [Rhodococcus pyridinivorans]|uniref:PaaX family transcriptional regulator C-terminal domain-containing protein n=1 Tax=Rhodococcus pyridinivorans TaxID=103816 RepID=UPI00207861BF|nr:PaaX family transcriptional regulator C-terminal domain-containing protein [Rhodococcus pyridinivorans]USI92958.1 PaaX domain-containing protein, C- domain protein [Rhodococcus pyridinivorans]